MLQKSNLDVAYELVQKKKNPVTFAKLWEEVSQLQGYTEEESKNNIGKFYTNLSLDGRFITLGENTWDLRERYPFDKVHIDMNDVYREVEEEAAEDIDDMDDKDESPMIDDSGEVINDVYEPEEDDSDEEKKESSDEDVENY